MADAYLCVCVREPTDCADGLCVLVKSTCTCIYMYMHMDLYTHVCIQIHISKAPRLAQLPRSASPSLRGRHQFWRQNPRQCLAWYRQKKSDSEWCIDEAYIRRISGVYQARMGETSHIYIYISVTYGRCEYEEGVCEGARRGGGLEVSCERDTRTFLCFSRQVHRESKLVNVKEAIAVNVREVPHLRG